MSQRTEDLIAQFLALHQELVATITRMTGAEWHARPAGEDRTAGQVMYHVAAGYPITLSFPMLIVRGEQAPALQADEMNRINAEQAAQHAGVTHEQVLALLEQNCAMIVDGLHSLSDAQLDTAGVLWGYPMTTQIAIEGIVFHHIREHMGNVQAMLATTPEAAATA